MVWDMHPRADLPGPSRRIRIEPEQPTYPEPIEVPEPFEAPVEAPSDPVRRPAEPVPA